MYPMIHITLEGMKAELVKAFSKECLKWDEDVKKALDAAVANFDVASYLTSGIQDALARELQQAIKDSVAHLFWADNAFRVKMLNATRAAILDKVLPEHTCDTCKEQKEGWVCEGQPTIEKNEKKAKDLSMLLQYLRAKAEAGKMLWQDFPTEFWDLVKSLEER
jgi:hypothetical protein